MRARAPIGPVLAEGRSAAASSFCRRPPPCSQRCFNCTARAQPTCRAWPAVRGWARPPDCSPRFVRSFSPLRRHGRWKSWRAKKRTKDRRPPGTCAGWPWRRRLGCARARLPWRSGRGSTDRRAKLDEYHQAFLEFARHSPREMAQVSGADEFMKAAQDVVTLTRGQTGKRQDAAAALAACRQLFAVFNALVVE
jgi:hypothetical protein